MVWILPAVLLCHFSDGQNSVKNCLFPGIKRDYNESIVVILCLGTAALSLSTVVRKPNMINCNSNRSRSRSNPYVAEMGLYLKECMFRLGNFEVSNLFFFNNFSDKKN